MWWWLVVVAMGVETPPEFWATSYVDIRHDDDGSTPCLGLPGGTCAAELDLAIDMINSLACGTAPTVNNDGADPVYPLLFDVNDGVNALIFHADPGTFTGEQQAGGAAVAERLAWRLSGADDNGGLVLESHA